MQILFTCGAPVSRVLFVSLIGVAHTTIWVPGSEISTIVWLFRMGYVQFQVVRSMQFIGFNYVQVYIDKYYVHMKTVHISFYNRAISGYNSPTVGLLIQH